MGTIPKSNFPGGSRERVNKAGNNVRSGTATSEDLKVIDIWRAAHRSVLNTFQAILRNRTRGTNIVVAQRHKRRSTIIEKLERFPNMQLGRMDDVAGCRLIFSTINDLHNFRNRMHAARFKHKLKNDKDKYDYIKRPKETGYRGIHDVYTYDVNSAAGKDYKGLLIELQYRTFFQHAWATAVEVVGFITESQPKFEKGDKRYQRIFRVSSEIISRSFEHVKSSLPEISDELVAKEFVALDKELNFMGMLRGLNTADSTISDKKNNFLLIFSSVPEGLEIRTFRDATDALEALFELERNNLGKDIVLVRANKSEDVRIAFRNYFSDAKEFINLIDEGCKKLMGDKAVDADQI